MVQSKNHPSSICEHPCADETHDDILQCDSSCNSLVGIRNTATVDRFIHRIEADEQSERRVCGFIETLIIAGNAFGRGDHSDLLEISCNAVTRDVSEAERGVSR